MASIQGIGGVFIDSDDPQRLAGWYEQVLGIKMEAHPDGSGYYHVFESRDAQTSILRENPVFAINKAKEKLPTGSRGFMINLRVDELEAMLKQIQAKGVYIEGKLMEWERGKHAWIRDMDGNRIELYEEIILYK
jgi:predicted enzyme related to lactoylglutathione lyase